ncbi:hypothetical protein ACP70R_031084 [Stipagrostis hirtigluma subsp. patula]
MRVIAALRLASAALRGYLRSLPASTCPAPTCSTSRQSSARVPAYNFFASGASDLAAPQPPAYYYPTVPSPSFRDMGDALLHFFGVGGADKSNERTKARLHQFRRIPEARGVLVNTFDRLEPMALRAAGRRRLRARPADAAGLLHRVAGQRRQERRDLGNSNLSGCLVPELERLEHLQYLRK